MKVDRPTRRDGLLRYNRCTATRHGPWCVGQVHTPTRGAVPLLGGAVGATTGRTRRSNEVIELTTKWAYIPEAVHMMKSPTRIVHLRGYAEHPHAGANMMTKASQGV